jgi:hypothetical protein
LIQPPLQLTVAFFNLLHSSACFIPQPASFLSLLPLSSYYYYFSFKRKYFIKERRGELKERQRAEGEAAG